MEQKQQNLKSPRVNLQMKTWTAQLPDAEVSSRRLGGQSAYLSSTGDSSCGRSSNRQAVKSGSLVHDSGGWAGGGGRLQQSLQTPERKRASQLTAECPRDRLGMEGCREGRHEERQEEGGAPALPVQMRLELLFARVGREEKPNTPQKCEKRRSGSVRGGGGFT